VLTVLEQIEAAAAAARAAGRAPSVPWKAVFQDGRRKAQRIEILMIDLHG
jgi:hypothetical protein